MEEAEHGISSGPGVNKRVWWSKTRPGSDCNDGEGNLSGEGDGAHSCAPAWKIPWTDEPDGLQSVGSLESDTTERLHFHFSLSCIGEGMATHSSVLAWRIPGTGEPGGLLSMGSHRVGHDWSDLAAAAAGVMRDSENMIRSMIQVLAGPDHGWGGGD